MFSLTWGTSHTASITDGRPDGGDLLHSYPFARQTSTRGLTRHPGTETPSAPPLIA